MASEAWWSDSADPLAEYSVVSLLPRTLGVLKRAPEPYDLERDLDSLHDHLKSVALRSPKRLLAQAEAIVSNSSEPLDSKAASENENLEKAVMANEVARKRRPGLGLKRPRFSLKSDSSQPMVTLEPTFDIDKYNDPDEFFEAYEMFENAKREVDRQTGVSVDQNQSNIVRNARPRRPGTLRKSFKNLFDQSAISSQVTSQNDIVLGPVYTTQPAAVEFTDETESAGSEMAPNMIDELLDDLLSRNCEDFDGDGAANLLQKCLQIKPVNIENLSLPDMQDVRGNDLNASHRETSQGRQALSDIQNIMKRIYGKSLSKSGNISTKNIPSPPSKSPLAPSILLKKRLFKDNSIDPYSAANIDVAATKNSPLSRCLEIHSDFADMRKDPCTSGKSNLQMAEEDAGRSQYNSNDKDESFNLKFVTLEEDLPNASADMDNRMEKVAVASPQFDVDMQNSTIGEDRRNEHDQMETHNEHDQMDHSTFKDDGTDGTFTGSDGAPEKPTELLIDFAGATKNLLNAYDKSKARPSKDRLKKGLSKRQSLAAAGTSWNSGVRRSTRIRSRPLEHWKGERFLYGRVHNSLATVIGIKYVSPGSTDGKRTLKVKSYVSDEYKELVELASFH